MNSPFRGLGVALATPFGSDGSIDTKALVRLVGHVVGGGADFVIALGSTGEAATLDERERDHVIATVRENAGSAPVVVGTGSSSTAQSVAWCKRARALGAAGTLVVVPPYNKPSQSGLQAHFRAAAEAAPDLPLVLYNVPSRTGTNLLPMTVQQLWPVPNIVAIKESSGDLQQIAKIAADLPPGRTLLAGDDALALPSIAVGADGLISVAGNAAPAAMRDLVAAARAGAMLKARRLHATLLPLFDALFVEPNPIPVKAALAWLRIAEPMLRLPLQTANLTTHERVANALRAVHAAAEQESHHG
jgi:4-hydroxy-tetrahydrodipicolinate synthase